MKTLEETVTDVTCIKGAKTNKIKISVECNNEEVWMNETMDDASTGAELSGLRSLRASGFRDIVRRALEKAVKEHLRPISDFLAKS